MKGTSEAASEAIQNKSGRGEKDSTMGVTLSVSPMLRRSRGRSSDNSDSETVTAADSVMGVTLFRDNAPNEFGYFTLALYSMFRLTAGETQVARAS